MRLEATDFSGELLDVLMGYLLSVVLAESLILIGQKDRSFYPSGG
jgi:hypothetical protein